MARYNGAIKLRDVLESHPILEIVICEMETDSQNVEYENMRQTEIEKTQNAFRGK